MGSNVNQKLESYSTICWLGMDACWMLKFNTMALAFGFLAVILSIGVIITCDYEKMSNILLSAVSTFWIFMNLSWMASDIFEDPSHMLFAKIFFGISVLLIISAYITSKRENTKIDIKRFKIK